MASESSESPLASGAIAPQARTIARPYAQAILALCQEQGLDLDAWQNLLLVCKVALEDPVGQQVLKLAPSRGARAPALAYLRHVLPPELDSQLAQNFLQVLADHGRFAQVGAIYEAFVALRKDLPLPCTVYAARVLQAEELSAIGYALMSRFNASIALKTIVDPTILSGLVITGKDFRIDCSGLKTLTDLKAALLK